MIAHDRAEPFAGNKGFGNLPTGRLADALRRYKKLRSDARDQATRDYARQTVAEIRAEFARRQGETPAVAA